MIDNTTGAIQYLAVPLHHDQDITLVRRHPPPLAKRTLCVADLRYLEDYSVVVPFKKPKTRSLEPEEKDFNQRLRSNPCQGGTLHSCFKDLSALEGDLSGTATTL